MCLWVPVVSVVPLVLLGDLISMMIVDVAMTTRAMSVNVVFVIRNLT